MKKRILTLLTILITTLTFACSCIVPKPVIEFYSANYVFEGRVASKVYAPDSLTYAITFDVSKHYKHFDTPKEMKFTFNSEGKYTGIYTSCDWNIDLDELWLVYASIKNNKLTFGYHCSNSKRTAYRKVTDKEQKVLDNGNSFKLENYIFSYEKNFNYPKPITNIDSILKTGKIKNYNSHYTHLKLLIDKNGDLLQVATYRDSKPIIDSIFNLPIIFEIKNNKPLSEFQKDAIALVIKISKWEIKRHDLTDIPVRYIKPFTISFDNKTKQWKEGL